MTEIPWYLQVAIDHALIVLNWYENLQRDEVPPEYLWEDVEGLEQWWKDIEARREDGAPTKRGSQITRNADDPSGDGGTEMVENDLARSFKR